MAGETTPLLGTRETEPELKKKQPRLGWLSFEPTWPVMIAGLLISASFGLTQTPILYAFRQMVCEDYYSHHPPYAGSGDSCNVPAVNSGKDAQFAILGSCTVFFAISNLVFTGWQMRNLGPKKALLVQNFFPVIRVLTQSVAISIGGATGITLFQLGQAITILGGPAGYILVLNTILSELIEQAQRTSMFGKLQGYILVGNAMGFLGGGVVSDRFGVVSPFRLGAICLSATLVFCATCVPPVSLKKDERAPTTNRRNAVVASFVDPLLALGPQKLRLKNGTITTHYGVTILAVGIFVGVLATGYVAQLLQQYSMDVFDFDASKNSALMALTLVVRGLFLMFIFPIIISSGRKWFDSTSQQQPQAAEQDAETVIPTHPLDMDPTPQLVSTEEEPVQAPPAPPTAQSGHFDLFFLRYSYLVDAVITMCAAFISDGWQFYLMAVLLPLASGSYAASKGVLTEMIPESQKADALAGMTLVESLASVSTLGLFGAVFSSLVEIGKAHLTFYLNAAIALLAIIILLFSRYPAEDSKLIEQEEEEQPSEEPVAA
ncbi:uncharacterized protein B0I36DRAFT_247438 [Microdochium trichocladiopsis]|uniref:Major facilitator superfamily domain-containing protein n=1 Tax=Microdochium trichocladiopsis TaxID=1682393 RepID=A0A9P8Y3H6_9PEZI|nr:uncharacterized protein B0I36DRAFT_247438 [Microdochium trichocladiopsis]KAH7028174.1 hypothetical protein B0I36DRAFT_247438 [Microdochium trichocladiopsis]